MVVFFCVLIAIGFILFLMSTNSANAYHPERVEKLTKMPATSNPSGLCPDYVVIDLETTGLSASNSEIIEIGAIKYLDHTEVERFHTYVKPYGGINPEAFKVNHITHEMVKNAPDIEAVKNDFLDFVGSLLLVGYNVKFDIEFIQTRMQVRLYNPFLDVLPLARHWFNDVENHKLETVKKSLGITSESHNAISDCETTLAALKYCIKKKNETLFEKSPMSRVQQPLSELQKSYFDTVHDILIAAIPGTSIFAQSYDGVDLYIYPVNSFVPFCFIKQSGKLKYWLSYSPVPVVEPICGEHFKCKAATKTEGENYTRISIEGPEDISVLKEIIIRDYNNAALQVADLF